MQSKTFQEMSPTFILLNPHSTLLEVSFESLLNFGSWLVANLHTSKKSLKCVFMGSFVSILDSGPYSFKEEQEEKRCSL